MPASSQVCLNQYYEIHHRFTRHRSWCNSYYQNRMVYSKFWYQLLGRRTHGHIWWLAHALQISWFGYYYNFLAGS